MQQLTTIVVTKSAYDDLVKIDAATRRRMKNKITDYMVMDNPLQYAVKLPNPALGTYRWNIGDYRLYFDVDKQNVVILRVVHHRSFYR